MSGILPFVEDNLGEKLKRHKQEPISIESIIRGDESTPPISTTNKKDEPITSFAIEEVNDDPDELIGLRGEGRYFGVTDPDNENQQTLGPICDNCHERGHRRAQCKVVICHKCGKVGDHYESQCPTTLVCLRCGEKGHYVSQCKSKIRKKQYCRNCDTFQHGDEDCPSIWRSYLTKRTANEDQESLVLPNISCYNCGSDEHFGDECNKQRSSRIPNLGSAFSGNNLPRNLRPLYFLRLKSSDAGSSDDYNPNSTPRDYDSEYDPRTTKKHTSNFNFNSSASSYGQQQPSRTGFIPMNNAGTRFPSGPSSSTYRSGSSHNFGSYGRNGGFGNNSLDGGFGRSNYGGSSKNGARQPSRSGVVNSGGASNRGKITKPSRSGLIDNSKGKPQPFTWYTAVNCLILTAQIGYRIYLTRVSTKGEVRVIDVSPNLALIEFPNAMIAKPATAPGAHIRLTNYSSSIFMRVFKQVVPNYHPYTLVSLPQDRIQKLLIRKSNFRLYNGHRYLITGTYDPHLLFINYKQSYSNKKFSLSKLHVDAKRILIVVGGSAISFALPILRVMNYHGIPTKVVWVIKDFRDVLALKYFDGIIHGDDFEIFVTGNQTLQDGQQRLKNAYSYASNLSRRSDAPSAHYDLENEETPLLGGTENEPIVTLNRENQDEDVDIVVNSDDDDEGADNDANCTRHDTSSLCRESSPEQFADLDEVLSDDANSLDYDDNEFEVTNNTINTRRSSFRSSLNEPFVPTTDCRSTDQARSWVSEFKETTRRLNLDKKIYKGRPKLSHRYYKWCINEGFTQCSGPVEDENHNLICCRDLPQNKVVQEDINAEKIWVIGAGPRQLVENVKLWSSENGLKFHEEAFYS
ncbi:FRE8 [Candida theae]|uniref:FRE8 n=1 Tax=Candida theae TaxID=1198502 RepID=A0AAD5BIB4_9ASCO|nr:FRE8 [Candida theae]KAI5965471.1 FRE8 [Candida theae]